MVHRFHLPRPAYMKRGGTSANTKLVSRTERPGQQFLNPRAHRLAAWLRNDQVGGPGHTRAYAGEFRAVNHEDWRLIQGTPQGVRDYESLVH
jgi:hypothetical protein